MSSLSDGTAAPLAKRARVNLDFVATEAGTYTLVWERDLAVGQPYPNPASGASRMEVVLDEAQDVKVTVYDALGREVAVAHEGTLAAGDHVVALPVSALSAGTCVVCVTGASVAETRRLTVVR